MYTGGEADAAAGGVVVECTLIEEAGNGGEEGGVNGVEAAVCASPPEMCRSQKASSGATQYSLSVGKLQFRFRN